MIGRRLRELRSEFQMTQTELGKRVGASKQAVSSWENDVSQPSNDVLVKMSEVFSCSIDYILGNVDTRSTRDKQSYLLSNDEKVLFDTLKACDNFGLVADLIMVASGLGKADLHALLSQAYKMSESSAGTVAAVSMRTGTDCLGK